MSTMHKATRRRARLRLGLSGPSGSGKTYSALLLARGLASSWDKICLIDTENGSGELYANSNNIGEYNVITLRDFSPDSYISAIKEAEKEGMEVLIIDSITHEWKNIIDMVDRLTQASNAKNSYTSWNKATPLHDRFIQSMLQSNCHIISTVRSKQDYDMSKDDKGKTTVTKVGMKQETREGFEYELTCSFDITMSHNALISKDRTGIFDDIPFVITTAVGEKLKEWNDSGAEALPEPPPAPLNNVVIPENRGPAKVATPPPAPKGPEPFTPAPEDFEKQSTVKQINDLKADWKELYGMKVAMGLNKPEDESKTLIAAINMIEQIKKIGEVTQVFKMSVGEIQLGRHYIKYWRDQVAEKYTEFMKEKKDTSAGPGENAAEVAGEVFGDNAPVGSKK